MKKKNIYILGAGGHAKVCVDVIESTKKFNILSLIDKKKGKKLFNYKVISEYDFVKKKNKTKNLLIGIGQIKNVDIRKKIFKFYKKLGYKFPNIISKYSYVSKRSSLGEGILICHGVVINPSSKIDSYCIINSQSLIEHDVEVGKYCHISTRSVINGGVSIGDNTFIGSGAIIQQGVQIGNNCLIGAGVIIKKDIKSFSIVKK